jgi:hypothetical protein
MKDFIHYPKENRNNILNKFNISQYHIEKCIEKIKKKEPIVIDFLCHGNYYADRERNKISNFLFTLARTGDITTPNIIKRTLKTYKTPIRKLLYGNLSKIHKKAVTLGNKIKNDSRLNKTKTEARLYNGKNEAHYNKNGDKVRYTKIEKKAPPIYAKFTNKGSSLNNNSFFIEPDGVYFLEDSTSIWDKFNARKKFKTFNKKEWGSIILSRDLKELHNQYGIHKPESYYKSKAKKNILTRNKELNAYFNMKNPLFNYVKNYSLFIPDDRGKYKVSDIVDGIKNSIKRGLQKRGITEEPVILFTFLQCKTIKNFENVSIIRDKSDKINQRIIGKIDKNYEDYISSPQMNIRVKRKSKSKNIQTRKNIRKNKPKNKTRKRKRE